MSFTVDEVDGIAFVAHHHWHISAMFLHQHTSVSITPADYPNILRIDPVNKCVKLFWKGVQISSRFELQ